MDVEMYACWFEGESFCTLVVSVSTPFIFVDNVSLVSRWADYPYKDSSDRDLCVP